MPNDQRPVSKRGRPAAESKDRRHDLTERTASFGEAIIRYARRIPGDAVTTCPIDQMVRAGKSVGVNYCEADDAESRKDFRHKISLCLKEVKETRHWLRMMATAAPNLRDDAAQLWQEAKELNLIFASIRLSASDGP